MYDVRLVELNLGGPKNGNSNECDVRKVPRREIQGH